jgi:hypothetical protein
MPGASQISASQKVVPSEAVQLSFCSKMTTNRISERLIRLCTSSESVSSLLAKQPSMAPSEAWERLYGEHALKAADGSGQDGSESVTQDELEKAAMCGKWGPTKPGELFLKVQDWTLRWSKVSALLQRGD